mmetsp:Transcript_40029/g.87404  ORF Transcript_40029/g.87404 Transcript_40029/m.87404 type:complete len:362 (-) Transcript_40029:98-1183(-)|eukprot:CAMPEP_0170603584 /NCGR_PEP_ID=MMETSP0224-20130122/18988_1 /TAXON_ID=285029 /ORGANISM="Togula jolla, Strain CCCM 725" /LENGTH=361 /DNA_ID=CAMNT_0010928471 /DNA_START=43 /DNA_END=1128 /DNA_ORIENTATION=-
MAGQMVGSLESGSSAPVHDTQLDYYGKRVAAASGDGVVHVWEISDGGQKPAGTLKGHEGPVWKVSWAHPKFGSVVATCGYDMKVIIWKESPPHGGNWQIAYVDTSHGASVNDVQFCPWEHGLRLACASSDGTVSVLSYTPADGQWRRSSFPAHPGGAQAVSWMPVQQRSGEVGPPIRLATGGCDGALAIWKCEADQWAQEPLPMPSAHTDWIRAVAWRPDASNTRNLVASGGWDKKVNIWAQDVEGQPWRILCSLTMEGKVEGLSWSLTGSLLAVSFGEGEASLYKEGYDGRFEEVGKVSEDGYREVASSLMAQSAIGSLSAGLEIAETAAVAQAAAQPAAGQNNEFAAQQQSVLDSFGAF